MKELKPGMMCLIVGGTNENNIGKIVTLCSFVKVGDLVDVGTIRGLWSRSMDAWLVRGECLVTEKWVGGEKTEIEINDYCCVCHKFLMPLKGDDDELSKEADKDFILERVQS